jgi:hypothetical protein
VTRRAAWVATAALVVLAARTLAYALAPLPTPLAVELQRAAGGPDLVVVTVCSLGLAAGIAAAVLGLAVLAVRERLALAAAPVLSPPRVHPLRLAVRFAALFTVTSGAFALLESYLHWRAGLGWHGIQCLVGPMHRDAIPLLAGLSLVAVAVIAAADHLAAWARRTLARVRPRARVYTIRPVSSSPRSAPRLTPLASLLPARGPPGRVSVALET